MKEQAQINNPIIIPEDNPRLADTQPGKGPSKLDDIFGPVKSNEEAKENDGHTPRTETSSG